jgi:hypothetical protein
MSLKKPISFKTAAIIAVGLHVIVFVGIIALSSYRAELAKKTRELKRIELQAFTSNKDSWPTNKEKLKVVAKAAPTPAPTNRPTPPKSPYISTKAVQQQAEKFLSKQINNIKSFSASSPKPTKKTIYTKTIEDEPLAESAPITTRDFYNAMPRPLSHSSRTRNITEERTRVVRSYIVLQ